MIPIPSPCPTPDLLDRHQLRREQAIPTVSVLCGRIGLGVGRWRAWAARRGVAVVAITKIRTSEVVAAWARSLAATRDLKADATEWLARITGRAPGDLQRLSAHRSGHDFEWFWDGLAIPPEHATAGKVCRVILTSVNSPEGEHLLESLARQQTPFDCALLANLASLVPSRALATLLLVPPPESSNQWLVEAACLLAAIAAAVPALPVAVAAEAGAVDALPGSGLPAHTVAVVREGIVRVEALGENQLADRLRAAGVGNELSASARRLAQDGASEELAAAFAEAARCAGEKSAPEHEDAARSAAERFLFERLETLAATTGLFALNYRLDFRHGPAAAEIDLYAASLRLAVELDGSYYHLRDATA